MIHTLEALTVMLFIVIKVTTTYYYITIYSCGIYSITITLVILTVVERL